MSSISSSLKRMYEAAALVAVLNVLGLVALGLLLLSSGAVNGEKLQRVAAIIRGDEALPDEDKDTDRGAASPEDETKSRPIPKSLAQTQVDAEILRLEEERIKAELDQRLALNNSILLRVMAQREQFQREQEDANRKRQSSIELRRTTGFQKQIEIYEALNPKVALEHLLENDDLDEAAKILLEMNTRKAKKIIESSKRGEQMRKMKRILKRLRDVAPDRSGDLDPTKRAPTRP